MTADELQKELLEHLKREIGPIIGQTNTRHARAEIVRAVGEWTIDNLDRADDPRLMVFDVRENPDDPHQINVAHPRVARASDEDAVFLGRFDLFDVWAYGDIDDAGDLLSASSFELRFGMHALDCVRVEIDQADMTHPGHAEALRRISEELER